ncbi:EF-hand domain-containing protein [Planctomycetes bacterium K23_9]|uniref:EF-hand domain-containing protein n=1 Tax=Stieleria marina TaxID=1930275 RepID=A0A517NV12_9BACT|nr:hypothetical protein K239x_29460 [Planctomycetes bacterium K23_9]
MRVVFAVLPLIALAITPAGGTAQPPGRGGGPGGPPTEMILQLFTLADTNNDGSVTKAELAAAMRTDRGGNRPGRGGPPNGGPPPRNGNQQQGMPGQQDAASRPGEVLPSFVVDALNLDDRQKRQLTALQTEVDKRLARILTDEQEQQLQNQQPAGGDQGRVQFGRPQRPQ